MPNKIFKYPLEIVDEQLVHVPIGAKILTAAFQYEKLFLWVEIDENPVHQDKKIRIIGTGHEFTNSTHLEYITTVQQYDGKLIWHIYEDRA